MGRLKKITQACIEGSSTGRTSEKLAQQLTTQNQSLSEYHGKEGRDDTA